MNEIIIMGAGGHARVVADVIRLTGAYQIRGFLDSENAERHGETYEGSRILGGADLLPGLLAEGVSHAAVAIGDNEARVRIGAELEGLGYQLPVLVHPAATVANTARLDAGTVVCARAVINPATTVGRLVIINTAATVDHDCVIEDGVHVAPGVHIAGWVKIESGALVGVGAAVRPHITIGQRAVVGAGAAVVGDVEPGATVAGVPARVLS